MRHHWFFDFDGTLCDTEVDIKEAWKLAIRGIGRECPQFDQVYKTGPTLDQVTYMLFDDATPALVEKIRELFKQFYDASSFPNTHPYPGIEDWLQDLKAKGCSLYIATNKRYNPMGKLMRKLGWLDLFTDYYSFDMFPGERLKKAELLKRVMSSRGIDANDAVMVGDTKGDVDAGISAGLWTIGCTWGYGTLEELSEANEIR